MVSFLFSFFCIPKRIEQMYQAEKGDKEVLSLDYCRLRRRRRLWPNSEVLSLGWSEPVSSRSGAAATVYGGITLR